MHVLGHSHLGFGGGYLGGRYLLSRVVVGLLKLLAKCGVAPFSWVNYKQVYPFFAAGVWAVVMWIYETNPTVLQAHFRARNVLERSVFIQ
jgi:hypothetical protein